MMLSRIRFKLGCLKWYHWSILGLVLIYIIYIALSYLYLPAKLKELAQTEMAQLIGRDINVTQLTFNPFSLSLTVMGLKINDQSNKPLVKWERFYVNFSLWRSLFRWQIALKDLFLKDAEINIEKRQDGFNFNDILEKFVSEDQVPLNTETGPAKAPLPSEEKACIALYIDRIAIESGHLHFADVSGKNPAHSNLDDINLQFQNLNIATGDELLNPFDVNADMRGGGTIHVTGNYRIDPLYFDAKIEVNGTKLAAYSGFLENIIPVTISNGLLSLKTDVLVTQKNELQIELRDGSIFLNDLALDDHLIDPPMWKGKAFRVEGLSLDFQDRHVLVEQVTYDGIVAHQWLDKEGIPRFQSLLTQEAKEETPKPNGPPPMPVDAIQTQKKGWDILVKKFQITDTDFYFADKRTEIDASQELTDIDISIEDLTFPQDKKATLSVYALINNKGKISATGDLVLVPFKANLNYQLKDMGLASFSRYVEESSFLSLASGDLDIAGTLDIPADPDGSVQVVLDAAIKNLVAWDVRSNESLLSFDELKFDRCAFDIKQQNIHLTDIKLTKPEVFIEMSKEKELNLATLKKPAPKKQPIPVAQESQEKPLKPWSVNIAEIKIEQGTIHFCDESVNPAFETSLYSMNLGIRDVTLPGNQEMPFLFDASVDRYASFDIKGTLAPLARQPGFAFESNLKGLEMPRLSPYASTYIGCNLASGKLFLNLNYQLKDRKLKGYNNIIADQFFLGEAVKSDQAINAPIGLGLALLRDNSGVIDLDVGVHGDLDDPGFSVTGLIVKAFLNIITKASTAPFKLLGTLVGGHEDLGEAQFAAGESVLNPKNQERLQLLTEALAKRPQLAIVVQGNSSSLEDKKALQKQAVMAKVASLCKASVTMDSPGQWLLDEKNRDGLERLNKALKLKTQSERISEIKALNPDLNKKALILKAYEQMFGDICEKQEISDQALIALADRRALSIKQYLVETGQLDSGRIAIKKAAMDSLTGLVIRLELEAH